MFNLKTANEDRLGVSLGFDQQMVEFVGERMRTRDVREIQLATGMDQTMVLQESLRVSWWKRMFYLERKRVIYPLAFGGISTHPEEEWIGIPWFLATPQIEEYPVFLMKQMKEAMALHSQRYGRMENYVHVENEPSIKLLTHLGFTFEDPAPWGVQGALYRKFHWSK